MRRLLSSVLYILDAVESSPMGCNDRSIESQGASVSALPYPVHFGPGRRRHLRGFSLLEMSLVLIIAMIGAIYTGLTLTASLESDRARAMGQHARSIAAAANAYIVNNYQTLSASPATDITVADLLSQSLLPIGFSPTNGYGQSYAIHLVRTGTSPSWNIEGVVITTNALTIVGKLRLDMVGAAVSEAGSDAGMTNDSATLSGFNGGWSLTSAAYPQITATGQLGHRVGSGTSLYTQFLRRDGTLPMTGNLDMGGMTIINANSMRLTGVVIEGSACTTTGEVSRDGSGRVLSCVGGSWRGYGYSSWKDPVANFVDLPGPGNSTGDVRMVTGLARAFTWNGAAWVALAVDQNGNLTVPATLSATTATISGSATVGGRVTANSVQTSNYVQNFSENWSFLGGNSGGYNAQPQAAPGSAYLNDAYFRSVGRWASQMGDGGAFWYGINTYSGEFCWLGECQTNPKTGGFFCPAGYTAIGGLTGQAYRYTPWDQTIVRYQCVSN
jgi:type II secretory pathway pseudopilin PulG